ncbi:chromosome segregation SMC family protein [Roseospirillum parvum]|uniref:Chromosome partition protein Smc n=1 Tax=Roseospirillum parvum TaxID=83401 RepID=A0A1G8CQ92_9PROT|nr:AAA family ATPase [Roseospirillum parvum]SDH47628.1 chromosome segregation protein [Roseospirillum parvum]
MVHFTRLRLSGFKSFVEPTELLIEPGMTGIVGPNGCGKSNLVEALRWVMGESSARQMRGSEMDDVIFGGTDQRPARNLAEVSVWLDNRERGLKGSLADADELQVTRRIERGSGSAYRLNGRDIRAKDAQLLFADAATGARSTAIVSQGRIGAIINAKPAQRRALLEEAAGISGLHSRRHEAELRLKGAETNLSRLDDVLSTLNGQLGNLKRQARQAARYRELSDSIRLTETRLLYLRWRQAMQELDAARRALAEAATRAGHLEAEAGRAATAQAEAAEAVEPLRKAEAEAGARRQRLALERDRLAEDARRVAAARRDNEGRRDQIAADLERERARAADAAQALERLAGEKADLEQAEAAEAGTAGQAASDLKTASQTLNQVEARLAEAERQVAQHAAQVQAAERRVQAAGERRTRLEQRRAQAEAERERAALALAELNEAGGAGVAQAEAAEATARAAREAASQRAETAAATAREAADTARARETEAARLRAEAGALEALLAEPLSDASAGPGVIDRMEARAGFEAALGAALGDDLEAPEAAPDGPAGWVALPPLDDAPPLPPGVTPLGEVITAPPVLARRLAQVGIAADAAQAARLQGALAVGQRLVTAEGGLWRWDGLRRAPGAPSAAAARLAQKNRLAGLKADLAEAETAHAAAAEAARRAADDSQAATQADRAARQTLSTAEQALAEARRVEQKHLAAATQARGRLDSATEAASRAADEVAEAEAETSAAEQARAALGADSPASAELPALRQQVAEARGALVEARSRHDGLARAAETRRRRLSALAEEIAAWESRRAQAASQEAELAARAATVAEALANLEGRPEAIERDRTALVDRLEEAEAARRAAGDALAQGNAALSRADQALRQAESTLAAARENRIRAEGQVSTADAAVREVARDIAERLDATPDQAAARAALEDPDNPPPVDALAHQLARLSADRDALGPVNLRAEQEAGELAEQITTLNTERDDLIAAIARLRQGIGELNREGRQRLLASFEAVDRHFQNLFSRLFGGGKAHLSLVENDDPLLAGLEIMASPPGKRLQVLSLLSGGEQALTAVALLFAVFLTNPAPVCVLDEVDAPLDDANVDRFCTLVGELAAGATRFLVITHHRMTMARMDRLFGVTMAERGVSKLVGVDLRTAERLRER